MDTPETDRVDRSKISVARLTDPDDALAYWLSRSPVERLQAMEQLRRTLYGEDYDVGGVQKIVEIVKLDRG
ncbi:MAG: hypothetical protein HZB13_11700 [Acidobacteria bacterium]|nr:hypothetical protein [Acidobacteriota bacterium]